LELHQTKDSVLKAFEDKKVGQKKYLISLVDDHVFIKIPKHDQHFWSPQLHIEMESTGEGKSLLHGFFGPNPTVWTLFIFLHVIVATLFLGFGIWAYTNHTLQNTYGFQMGVMLLLVLLWIGLYFGGRIGKATGKKQMNELYQFMKETLR
jgi:hypothetical protein